MGVSQLGEVIKTRLTSKGFSGFRVFRVFQGFGFTFFWVGFFLGLEP